MNARRRIAVVTGSRADFGLLRPVMHAVKARDDLELLVIASGAHLIQPAETFRDVRAIFEVADSVPMQIAGRVGRREDAEALGRGVARFARAFEALAPDWVVVLGDRIEAFAAASCASVGGIGLAHIHGGDRAEGVADEAMRHAISKLAHLHFPATEESAHRLARMGEKESSIHPVGSPAIDGLDDIAPADDAALANRGVHATPDALVLLHPIGRSPEAEHHAAAMALRAAADAFGAGNVLAMHPNFDPGREGVLRAIVESGIAAATHLPRDLFVGLLKRVTGRRGVLIGNSSAALIEAAALRVPAVDIGDRQAGRERAGNVFHAEESPASIADAIVRARTADLSRLGHPYGDGRSGARIAGILARTDPAPLIRKRNTY